LAPRTARVGRSAATPRQSDAAARQRDRVVLQRHVDHATDGGPPSRSPRNAGDKIVEEGLWMAKWQQSRRGFRHRRQHAGRLRGALPADRSSTTNRRPTPRQLAGDRTPRCRRDDHHVA
jgi:hypothetical protein